MGQISLSLPVVGQPNATEDAKIPSDFTIIQNVINGNLDATNISATLAQSAGVNQGGQVTKGAVNIAASESRTNVAYGTLTTPDQVTGIVLPTNGLIAVSYQATWQESVDGAARAAIFVGASQLKAVSTVGAPRTVAAVLDIAGALGVNTNSPLVTAGPAGIVGAFSSPASSDVTTGQTIGAVQPGNVSTSTAVWGLEFGGVAQSVLPNGGPCYIFAAAGTYTISVQFKASSGSVTASNRKLWAQALAFA